jgi:2-(1,2-epoxy-1,2-dihydrophenyl)acetyl-CoA isomerase
MTNARNGEEAMPRQGLVMVAVADGIARVTLNRPERLNALDDALGRELADAFERLASDPALHVVTLMGAGRAFMAGGDVAKFKAAGEQAPEAVGAMIALFHRIIRCIRAMDAVVVAGVHGAAAGGGLGLALACDFVIAAEDALFVPAYTKLGTNPDGGTTSSVTRLIGPRHALEWLMLGDTKDARAAERLGLVNRVVGNDELAAEVEALARRIAAGPRQAYASLKRLIDQAPNTPFDVQLDAERAGFVKAAGTRDFREGVAAFLERRPPQFGKK